MREQHAADWSSYVEHTSAGWKVVFDFTAVSVWPTREQARKAVHVLKTVRDLSGFHTLSKLDHDRICARHGVDPDDDDLVNRLVLLGWTFNPFDDEYIAPDRRPEGRWGLIMNDDWLPDEPDEPDEPKPTTNAGLQARERVRAQFQAKPVFPLPIFDDLD